MMKYWEFFRSLFKLIYVNGNWIKLYVVYVNWNEFIVKYGIKFLYEKLLKKIVKIIRVILIDIFV